MISSYLFMVLGLQLSAIFRFPGRFFVLILESERDRPPELGHQAKNKSKYIYIFFIYGILPSYI